MTRIRVTSKAADKSCLINIKKLRGNFIMNLLTKTALCLAVAGSSCAVFASEAMEEIIVTARQ